MANNFAMRIEIAQERKPYSVVTGATRTTRFTVKTKITDIYVVDPLGAQGSVTLDKELFYAGVPDLQIYDFVEGELRQYSGGSVSTPDVTVGMAIPYPGNTGLSDITLSGIYTEDTFNFFTIEIVSTASPNQFSWSSTSGASGTSIDIVAGTPILLEDNVYIAFASETGHNLGDKWHVYACPLNVSSFTGSSTLDDITIGTEYTGAGPARFIVKIEPVVSQVVTSFSDNGSGKLRITVSDTADFDTLDTVYISNSPTYGNAGWPITVVDSVHIDIDTPYNSLEAAASNVIEKVNTIAWTSDGVTWTSGVSIPTSAYELSDGFTIQFAAAVGHTEGDMWIIPKFLSYADQGDLINTADYIRFADVTDFTGTLEDASSLSNFYKANRWVFVDSPGGGLPARYEMLEFDETLQESVPFTGELTYPTRFRTAEFIADFASVDAAVRHAEHLRNIINAFAKEYNALMNASFSTYEGDFPANEETYTFPQYS